MEYIEEQVENAFNTIAQPEEAEEKEFVYIVTDESGNLLGGCILSVDALRTASIYDLWVEEAFRRQGMASALMREAERKAREQGCYLAMVGTFDWQAKAFYDKHGYMLNDTMTDVPKGHEHYIEVPDDGTIQFSRCARSDVLPCGRCRLGNCPFTYEPSRRGKLLPEKEKSSKVLQKHSHSLDSLMNRNPF